MRVLRAALPVTALVLLASATLESARADDDTQWARETASPRAVDATALSDRDSDILARCGRAEAGLFTVAQAVVARKARGLPALDIDGLAYAQRSAGEPHVWPRAWLIAGRALDHASTVERVAAWQRSFRDLGERRCGVAHGTAADGTAITAVVAVDALADMSPLPLRARTGAWLTFDARLLIGATRAHLIVLGPSGTPRTVPTSIEAGHVRARFALDRPGPFSVQLVADGPTGPRPVLEASVFADVTPPSSPTPAAAPGEGELGPDAPSTLARMLDAVRAHERIAPLHRDGRLDALARAHAKRMVDTRTVGHDVGDGDPTQRLEAAGIDARETGENVAHAPTLALAHRALYASPSHRSNMLRSEFDALGVGVVMDTDGSVWVSELFTRGAR